MAQRLHLEAQAVEPDNLWLQFERDERQLAELQRRLENVSSSPSEDNSRFARADKIMICMALSLWPIVGGLGLLIT